MHALAAELPRTILVTGKNLINTPSCTLCNFTCHVQIAALPKYLDLFRVITQTLLPKCLASEEKLSVSLSHWATILKSVLQQYGGPFDGGHPDCCDSTS